MAGYKHVGIGQSWWGWGKGAPGTKLCGLKKAHSEGFNRIKTLISLSSFPPFFGGEQGEAEMSIGKSIWDPEGTGAHLCDIQRSAFKNREQRRMGHGWKGAHGRCQRSYATVLKTQC